MKNEITISENQTIKPSEIKAIRFERNEKGDFINATFYTTDDRMWAIRVEKTEILHIPEKIGTWFDVILSPTSKNY